MKLRIVPFILTAVLLAAHFLRSYSLVSMFFCLMAPFLLLVKKRWSLIVLQIMSLVASVIWLAALYAIIQERTQAGRSWTASAIILGVVAGFSLYSGWLLNSESVKKNYSW